MIDPRIPFITLPEIPIFPGMELPGVGQTEPITIKPFGTLVAIGVYAGWMLAMRQAKRLGFSQDVMNSFIGWILTGGFVGGHVFDVLLYHSDKLTEGGFFQGLMDLLFIWRSQSSFGGFMGALIGLFAWKYHYKIKDTLPYADTVAGVFPVGWIFGRMGCSVAHDHPGMRSDAWFAVQYPHGGRFDLGLYEMLITIPIALTCLSFMRKPRPYGFYIGFLCTVYPIVRFALDFLRARDVRDADPRHLGLTPAQWLCVAMLGLGIFMLRKAMQAASRGEIPHYVDESPITPDPANAHLLE